VRVKLLTVKRTNAGYYLAEIIKHYMTGYKVTM